MATEEEIEDMFKGALQDAQEDGDAADEPAPAPEATPAPEQADVFNPEKQKIYLTPEGDTAFVNFEDEEAAIQSGLEPGYIHIGPEIDIETGEPERIPVRKRDLAAAKENGLIPEWEANAKQTFEQAKKDIEVSRPEAFARGMASTFSMGGIDEVAGAKDALMDYLKNWEMKRIPGAFEAGRSTYQLKDAAAKEQHPGTYMTGQGSGFVAGMGLGGIVGKVAGPAIGALVGGTPRTLGQAAVGGAAMGGATGLLGGTERRDPTAPPELSPAVRTAIGAATGGVLGPVGMKVGQKVGPWVAEKAGDLASSRAVKSIAPTTSIAFQRVTDRLPGGPQKFGRDVLKAGIVKAGDTVDSMLDKSREIVRNAGARIGSVLQQLDSEASTRGAAGIPMQKIVDRVRAEVIDPLRQHAATQELANKLEKGYLEELTKKANEAGGVGFEWLHKERSLLDDLAFTPTGLDKPFHKQLQKIRRIMEDEIDATADALVGQTRPDLLPSYKQAKKAYQVGINSVQGLTLRKQKMGANRSISLTDYISGGAGATTGSIAAGAMGLPPTAGAAIGGGIGAIGNKFSRERGNPILANIAQELAVKFSKDPNPAQKVYQELLRMGLIGKEQ